VASDKNALGIATMIDKAGRSSVQRDLVSILRVLMFIRKMKLRRQNSN